MIWTNLQSIVLSLNLITLQFIKKIFIKQTACYKPSNQKNLNEKTIFIGFILRKKLLVKYIIHIHIFKVVKK